VQTSSGNGLLLATNGSYVAGTRLQNLGVDGKARFSNYAATGGVYLDTTVADTLKIRNLADSADGSIACANVTASGTINVTGAASFATNVSCPSGLFSANTIQCSAGGYIYWAGRTSLKAPTNGSLYITNLAETAGVTLDVTTDSTLKIRDRANAVDASLACANVTASGTVRLGTYTVATLPSAASNTRARAFVTDSNLAFNSTNLGSTVTAGGSTLVPVLSNGTNWVIG
jgi:hypothetical protein